MRILMIPWVVEICKRRSLSHIPTTLFVANISKIITMRGGERSAKRANPSCMRTLRYISGNNLTLRTKVIGGIDQ